MNLERGHAGMGWGMCSGCVEFNRVSLSGRDELQGRSETQKLKQNLEDQASGSAVRPRGVLVSLAAQRQALPIY